MKNERRLRSMRASFLAALLSSAGDALLELCEVLSLREPRPVNAKIGQGSASTGFHEL